MYKLVIKDSNGEMLEEISEDTLTNDDLIAYINAPFMVDSERENEEPTIFLKQRINSRAEELPYKRLKYNHNLKMSFAISQILDHGVGTAKRTLMTLNGLDKFERAYDKGILQFTQSDMERLREDWIATGTSNAFNISRGIKMLYELIQFCNYKNRQFGKKYNITNIKETKKHNLNIPVRSKVVLSEDEMLNTLDNDNYSIDSRMLLYLIYKGAVAGNYKDEISSIRLEDIDLKNREIHITEGLKGEKWLPIYDKEIQFLEKFVNLKRGELLRIASQLSESYPIEKMFIFTKQRGEVEMKPLQPQSIKHRYRSGLGDKVAPDRKKFFTFKNVCYSGMANDYKHNLEKGLSDTESVIKTMRHFSEISKEAEEDYTKINSDAYRKVKYLIKTYA